MFRFGSANDIKKAVRFLGRLFQLITVQRCSEDNGLPQ